MTINPAVIYQQDVWHTKFANIPVWEWLLCIIAELAVGIFAGIIPSLTQPGLLVIGLFITTVFIISLIRPLIAFGILLFSFPLVNIQLNIIYYGKNYFFLLIPPALAVVIAVALLFRTAAKLHRPQSHQIFLLVPIFLLICWSAMSTVWAQDTAAAWVVTIYLSAVFIIVYVLLQLTATEKILERILWLVICSGLITATAIILSTILSKSYQLTYQLIKLPQFTMFITTRFDLMSTSQRATGFGPHTVMALLMSMHIFFAVALLLVSPNRKIKIFLILMMMYMLYAHLLTKSRGPLLGLLLGLLVTILLLRPRLNPARYKPIFISLLVILICISLVLAVILQFEKGQRRFTSAGIGEKGTAFTFRATWLKESLTAFFETYGFGIGAGNIYRVLTRMSAAQPTRHSHNMYVHVVSELGLLGGIIWAVMGYSIIRNTVRAIKLKGKEITPKLTRMLPAFAGALVMLGIAAMLDYGYYMNELWIYLSLTLASINLALQPQKTS